MVYATPDETFRTDAEAVIKKSGEDVTVSAYVTVTFTKTESNGIFATNGIERHQDGRPPTGVIIVSNDLVAGDFRGDFDKMCQLRFVLAEEWLEAMDKLSRPDVNGAATPKERSNLMLTYACLTQRAPWQDWPDDQSQMHIALRELLVSRPSIDAMAKRLFGQSLSEISEEVKKGEDGVWEKCTSLAQAFASEKCVKYDLCVNRVAEFVLEKPSG